MDEVGAKVLTAARSFLERLIASNVLTSDQLTEAHMAVTALGYEAARSGYDPDVLARIRRREAALATEIRERLGSGEAPVRQWQHGWNSGVGAELTAILNGSSGTLDVEIGQQIREFLVAYHTPMDPVVGAGTRATYQSGRGDQRRDATAAAELTANGLEAYLKQRFSDQGDTRVLEVKRLMGGYSKATYFVKLEDRGIEKIIVIRKDGHGLPTGSSVVSEFAVLKEVHAFAMPVPEPLWLEADTRHFATAFMAVGYRRGTPANQIVPEEKSRRVAWAREIGRSIALLHTCTSRPDADVRDALRAEITDLQRRIEERERQPHPGLAFGMRWLTDHIDDLAGRPACRVHGDAGFHNMLMEDDKLIALLDWEFSRLGDPVEDLAMIKPFMDQIESWPEFQSEYRAGCSFETDPRAERYFRVWVEVRNMVACLGSLNSLLLPEVTDVALSVAGTIYIPKYEIAVIDAILEEGPQS